MKIQFETGTGRHFENVNYLIGNGLYAEVEVPEGASEDYGYVTMKCALTILANKHNVDISEGFWYDGQEHYLEADAKANCPVYVELETEDDSIDVREVM